jgi:hypothetical protein
MTDDMDYDLAKELRESANATFYDPLKSELNRAADRIEKLETALREIAALGFWDGDSAMSIANKALDAK